MWESVEVLERDQNHLNQYNRRENIEITGIPENIPQDKLEDVCIDILRRIGVNALDRWEIAACHRLRKTEGQTTSNVIIRFINRKRAISCLQNRKYLKETIPEYPNLYLFENLCPRYKSIMDECKKLKNTGEIRKVWTFNGTINFKKTDSQNERPKKLFHIYDLNKYFPNSSE